MLIGYAAIGMPNAFLMSVFATITSVIPFIGPFLGILPALLIAATIDLALVIKIIILAIVVQQVEGDFITPRIMGNKLDLHPLLVMIIVLVSVHLFGILGAFIGIPLYLIILTVIDGIFKIVKINKG